MELRIKKLELIMAGLLFFLPLILLISAGEVRSSISDYAYSSVSNIFVALLTLAGALFIYNGVINRSKWYNIVLGISLIGIGNTPHLDYPVLHYFFAAVYFVGSMLVIPIYTSSKQRLLKLMFSLLIGVFLSGYLAFDWYSLFYAEWLALLVICVHFVGESIGKFE